MYSNSNQGNFGSYSSNPQFAQQQYVQNFQQLAGCAAVTILRVEEPVPPPAQTCADRRHKRDAFGRVRDGKANSDDDLYWNRAGTRSEKNGPASGKCGAAYRLATQCLPRSLTQLRRMVGRPLGTETAEDVVSISAPSSRPPAYISAAPPPSRPVRLQRQSGERNGYFNGTTRELRTVLSRPSAKASPMTSAESEPPNQGIG